MKKKALRKKIEELTIHNTELHQTVTRQIYEMDVLREDLSEVDSRANLIEEIHQQIVYQGKDPLDVLDDLFREEGFLWKKAA